MLTTRYSMLATASASLRAQRDHGIDLRGAPGGEPAGERSGGEKDERDPGRGGKLGAGKCRHHRGQQTRDGKRAGETDQRAKEREAQALSEDEAEDVANLGAEGHADADLVRALRDEAGDHAVDANGGEHEAERGETGKHPANERHVR